MNENGFRPEDLAEKAEAAEKKAEEFASEALNDLENAAVSAENAAEDAIRNAEEKAAEKFEDLAEEVRNTEEKAAEEFSELKEEIAEGAEDFAEEAKEAFEEEKEAVLEEAEALKEEAEETVEGLFTEIPEKAEEVRKDFIEAVSFNAPEESADELQDFRTLNSHKPSIPQYVPKTYAREIPEEPEFSGVRGAVSSPDYEGFPPVDDVEPAPRGVLNGKPAEKSNKTVLWIVLAILVCLVIAGCCLVQAFFGILNLLAG